ncbi:MAG: helix-turn-helix domain-containing protein [Terriglobia bacterium]
MTRLVQGYHLRELREKTGLTLKEVEARSRHIAQERQNRDYLVTAGRLSQIENSNSLPSLYKLASLSQIYNTPYTYLLSLYGINAPEETELATWCQLPSSDPSAGR